MPIPNNKLFAWVDTAGLPGVIKLFCITDAGYKYEPAYTTDYDAVNFILSLDFKISSDPSGTALKELDIKLGDVILTGPWGIDYVAAIHKKIRVRLFDVLSAPPDRILKGSITVIPTKNCFK